MIKFSILDNNWICWLKYAFLPFRIFGHKLFCARLLKSILMHLPTSENQQDKDNLEELNGV